MCIQWSAAVLLVLVQHALEIQCFFSQIKNVFILNRNSFKGRIFLQSNVKWFWLIVQYESVMSARVLL